MNNKVDITDSEWKIMQVLWGSEAPMTIGEIAGKLGDTVTWNKRTVHTLIRRLMEKNAVSFKEARYYEYYPLVSEKECLRDEVLQIIKNRFHSSPKKLMAALIDSEDLSAGDIDEVMDILKDIKKRIDS